IIRYTNIVIAITDPYFEKRVLHHRAPQCFGYIEVFLAAIAPWLYTPGEYFIRNIIFILKIAADIIINSRGIGTIDRDIIAGIVVKFFTRLVIILAGDPGIQTTHSLLVFSQYS